MRRSTGALVAVGGGLAVVLVGGVGGLALQALAGADRAEAARHEQVAARLFDELERELSTLVAREEDRSFLEYRNFYVPVDNALGSLVQSPLAALPDLPFVVGYFQIDPDGALRTPHLPGANEVAVASSVGWSPDPAADEVRRELDDLARRLPRAPPAPEPVQAVAKANPPPQKSSSDLLFNQKGAQLRSQRAEQTYQLKTANLEAFNPSEQNVLDEVNQAPRPLRDERDTDVHVTPISGARYGDRLVLSRTVRIGAEEHLQGLALRIPELEAWLQQRVLTDADLAPHVTLGWDGAEPAARVHRFTHTFAAPFGELAVVASVDRLPELVDGEATRVRALVAGLLAAGLLGGLGLALAVRAELDFARRRSDFVAAVSHELKTPLTTIRMYAEMLRDGMVPDPGRQRDYHHTITVESERLSRLIGNVLELARMERGGPAPTPVVGAVGPVLDRALELVEPHARAAGFTLRAEVDPDLPPVRLEPDALVQVLVNLVDNAVKFAADGERVVHLRAARAGDGVELRVRDHGPGVPAAHLRQVFEPFWRGERELTRRTRGTGIGLALVRGLIEQMGGAVQARNHPDGGFEVALRLSGP